MVVVTTINSLSVVTGQQRSGVPQQGVPSIHDLQQQDIATAAGASRAGAAVPGSMAFVGGRSSTNPNDSSGVTTAGSLEPVIARKAGNLSGDTDLLEIDKLTNGQFDVQCTQDVGKDGSNPGGSWFHFLSIDFRNSFLCVRRVLDNGTSSTGLPFKVSFTKFYLPVVD